MSLLESIQESAFNSNYVYILLLQKYRFNSTERHYVFEGFDDQSFYFNYLQPLTNEYRTYISHGKKQTIELYNQLDWEKYDKKRVILFIDRDYSRILGESIPADDNIYETTFYSIENYVSDPNNLTRLINELLHFHDKDVILKIVATYTHELANFVKLIRPLISWILIIRSQNLKANLNMVDLSKLFMISKDLSIEERKINKVEYLEKVTGTKTPKTYFSVFKGWYLIFNSLPSYKCYVRGKYEMWFLIEFFNQVKDYLKDNYGHNSKQKTFINLGNGVEVIGPRTLLPEKLKIFLEAISRN